MTNASRLFSFVAAAALAAIAASNPVSAAQPRSATTQIARDPLLGINAASLSASKMYKWHDMAARHRGNHGASWATVVTRLRATPKSQLLQAVNAEINRARYVSDQQNWGRGDYWATPAELLSRGGDCEDYAAAKYLALRELGVPSAKMRILLTRDHAVLVVQTETGAMVLDNQRSQTYRLDGSLASRTVMAVNDANLWLNVGGAAAIARIQPATANRASTPEPIRTANAAPRNTGAGLLLPPAQSPF